MSNWNNGYLNKSKLSMVYSFYLESSDVCNFDIWLKRHTDFSDYQIKRLMKFRDTPTAANICHCHAFD